MLVILSLAGFVAANWAPDRSAAELPGRWAPSPSTFFEIAGMQVHMRDEGLRDDPTPIILRHGTSASLHTWDGWTKALILSRRVIRLDLPGFGLTGAFPDNDYNKHWCGAQAERSRNTAPVLDFVAGILSAMLREPWAFSGCAPV